jgi:hypothetical protein
MSRNDVEEHWRMFVGAQPAAYAAAGIPTPDFPPNAPDWFIKEFEESQRNSYGRENNPHQTWGGTKRRRNNRKSRRNKRSRR